MLKNIFGSGERSKSGFFKIVNDSLTAINEMPGNGSINSCIEESGFAHNLIHVVHTFDSQKISCIGFKILSKQPVFIWAKDKEAKISYSDVQASAAGIDWKFEYSSIRIQEILNEGIELNNITYDFLKGVTPLEEVEGGIYSASELSLYLQFEGNTLKYFTSTTMQGSATKWLMALNLSMVERITDEAKIYQPNDVDAHQEVEKQIEALRGIPHAVNNEFIPLHTKQNGNVNFYNLLIAHYIKSCNLDEFLMMNRGRLDKITETVFEVGEFLYFFNDAGQLDFVIPAEE